MHGCRPLDNINQNWAQGIEYMYKLINVSYVNIIFQNDYNQFANWSPKTGLPTGLTTVISN